MPETDISPRPSGRRTAEMRAVGFTTNFTRHAEGSVLACFGETRVLCTASVESGVPAFLRNSGRGWITAEYGMLPRSTHSRMRRESAQGKQSGTRSLPEETFDGIVNVPVMHQVVKAFLANRRAVMWHSCLRLSRCCAVALLQPVRCTDRSLLCRSESSAASRSWISTTPKTLLLKPT